MRERYALEWLSGLAAAEYLEYEPADGRYTLPPEEPTLRLLVLTCMDARLDPAALLGLRSGEAHVIRNAGGLASPETLEALRLSRTALGTREAMVVHHTDCAALAGLGRRDAVASARAEVERVRAAPGRPAWKSVRGFVLDLANGRLSEVGEQSGAASAPPRAPA